MAPKYILEQFLETELLVNVTQHEVCFCSRAFYPQEKKSQKVMGEFAVKSCNLSLIYGEISAFHRELLKNCSFSPRIHP